MQHANEPVQDPATVRRVAAAVLHRAVQDARGIECSQATTVEALVWLGSRNAEPWFDLLEMPQDRFLDQLGWVDLVDEAVANPRVSLTEAQAGALRTTYNCLRDLFDPEVR